MTEQIPQGWNILIQFGAVGLMAAGSIYVAYKLLMRFMDEAKADKALLLTTLTKTVQDNTNAMNNVAEALRSGASNCANFKHVDQR